MTDTILEGLTGPGAPFELVDAEVGGVPCKLFKETLPCLSALYAPLESFADNTFVVYEGTRLTYREAGDAAAALAAWLQDEHELGAGSRVAIAMRNCPEWIIAFLAITAMGGVAVLVNSRGTGEELAYCVSSTRCDAVVADARCAAALAGSSASGIPRIVAGAAASPAGGGTVALCEIVAANSGRELPRVAREPDDTALILFTSGTTGRPKGALLTQRGVLTALRTNQLSSALIGARMAQKFGIDLATLAANSPTPCTLLMFPLFHVSGCHSVLLPALTQGSKIVLMHRWNAVEAMKLIEAEKVTTFPGVPTMHWDLLQSPERGNYDLSSLGSMSVGGQATPLPLLEAIRDAFPNAVLGTGYGMTETNGALTIAIGETLLSAPTNSGVAVATAEIRLLGDDGEWVSGDEPGEICVRGATVMTGYDNQPEANEKCFRDGWFLTGDVGQFDDQGRIYIVDRKTDMVISGGENIYCAEVERALVSHPAVLEVATLGIPDDRLGEALVAVVRLRGGHEATAADLEQHVAGQLAAYKVPRETQIIATELPRNPAGKVLKGEVRKQFLAARDV